MYTYHVVEQHVEYSINPCNCQHIYSDIIGISIHTGTGSLRVVCCDGEDGGGCVYDGKL